MEEDDFDMQEQWDSDMELVEEVGQLIGTHVQARQVSSMYFLELMATCWTYLRTLHLLEDANPLVLAALRRAEQWLRDDPVVIATNEAGEDVEVPLHIAETGGMGVTDDLADEMFKILSGNFGEPESL